MKSIAIFLAGCIFTLALGEGVLKGRLFGKNESARPPTVSHRTEVREAAAMKVPEEPKETLPMISDPPHNLIGVLQMEHPEEKTLALLKLIAGTNSRELPGLAREVIANYVDGKVPPALLQVAMQGIGGKGDAATNTLILKNPRFIKEGKPAIIEYLGALAARHPKLAIEAAAEYQLNDFAFQSAIFNAVPDESAEMLTDEMAKKHPGGDDIKNLLLSRSVARKGYEATASIIEGEFAASKNVEEATGQLLRLSNHAAAANTLSLEKFINQISNFKHLDVNTTGPVTAAVATLAKLDLDAGFEWVANAPPSTSKSIGLSMLMAEAASQDPDRVLSYIRNAAGSSVDEKLNMLLGLRNGVDRSGKLTQGEKSEIKDQVQALYDRLLKSGK